MNPIEAYPKLKAENPEAILLFRIGDFVEAFYDDAVYVSKVLGLTITTRDPVKGRLSKPTGNPMVDASRTPMCGFPYHQQDAYVRRLVSLGKRVAIVEQNQ